VPDLALPGGVGNCVGCAISDADSKQFAAISRRDKILCIFYQFQGDTGSACKIVCQRGNCLRGMKATGIFPERGKQAVFIIATATNKG